MIEYDIAIIGAGAGGLTAAYTAKGFSKKVLLIDKNKPGGECTWSGCIPSKALINMAKEIYMANNYSKNVEVNIVEIMNKIRAVIENVYKGETPEVLIKDDIDYMSGFAQFIDKNTLQVNGEKIKAKKIIISTGSSPLIPNVKGLDKIKYFTNENIFLQENLPKSIIVLGAGAIGVELSQAFNRLGIRVSIVEMMDNILFKEEKEIAKLLEKRFIYEGIEIYTSAKAVEVNEIENKIILKVEKDGNIETIQADGILLAMGRVPNLNNLNLEAVGIKFDKKSIKVNEYMETSIKGIYAIGDVVGPYQFSHMANVQGIAAVQNAILPLKKKVDYNHVSWCTYSDPELARAGFTEKEARETYGDNIRVYIESYTNLDRAKIKTYDSIGMVKIICNKKGYIVGATVLGERAGEIISEIQTIKTLGINLEKISKVIHPYPTYSEILVKISKRVYVDNLLNNPFIKIINFFRKQQ